MFVSDHSLGISLVSIQCWKRCANIGPSSDTSFLRLWNAAQQVLKLSRGFKPRLAKRREILIFPRTAGNTGNSRELLVIPGNYWEISYLLTKKLLIYLLTAIQL